MANDVVLNGRVIESFTKSFLLKKYNIPVPIPDFHRTMWELCCSGSRRVAICAPRNHAKSTAITHAFLLANVLFRNARYVLIVSDTETQASNFLMDIKTELLENQDLMDMFAIKRFIKESVTDIIVEMYDGWKFRITAQGAEQKVRGKKWGNQRPDLVICHEEGTEIFTPESGWCKNQDYPDKKRIFSHEVYEIEFEDGTKEIVSSDHRYLTEQGWKYIWEMTNEDSVLENINEDTLNEILKRERNLSKNTTLSQKLRQKWRNGKQIMLLVMLLQSGNIMRQTKKGFLSRLKNSLAKILHGKLRTALNVELQRSKQYQNG